MLVAVTFAMAPDDEPEAPQAQPAPRAPETAEERQQRLLTSFDGALTRVSDGGDFDESGGYLDMVRWMSQTSDATVRQRTVDSITDEPNHFEWNVAMQTPALLRGQFVRVRGLVSDIHTIKLKDAQGDVTDVYRCFVCEPDGSEQTVIDLVKRPNPVPEEERDVVDFDAVYMRNVAYESEMTGRRIELPYLIGRTLTVYSPPRSNPLKLEGQTMWAVIGGLAVITVLVIMRMSRQKQSYRRRTPALAGKEGVSMRALFEMRMREDDAKRAAGVPEQKPPKP